MLNIFSIAELMRTKRVLLFIVIVCIVGISLFSFTGSHNAYAQSTNVINSLQSKDVSCGGLGTLTDFSTCVILPSIKFIAEVIFDISAWFATATGELLDISLKFTLDGNTYEINGIHIAWEVFRDLANITFIFILLYIAAMTILQLGGFQTKRILSSLIIVALLVNFSFFFTRVVIDAGNVMGGFMYSALTPDVQVNTITTLANGTQTSVVETKQREIGQTFMTAIKAASLLDKNGLNNNGVNDEKLIMIYLLGSVVFLVAGFVFLAGSILFFIRTVTLLFLIFISPLAFVAAILPKTNTYWSMWLGKLVGNSFVAPIYLVLISVVVIIASDDSLFNAATASYNNTKGAGAPDLNTSQSLLGVVNIQVPDYTLASHSAILITYVVMIGLLLAALSVSQKVAGGLGAQSSNWAKKVTGFGIRTAGAGAGAVAFATEYSWKRLPSTFTGSVVQRCGLREFCRASSDASC